MLLQAQLESSTAMADMAKDSPDHNGNAAKGGQQAISTAASMASMAQAIYAMSGGVGAPGGAPPTRLRPLPVPDGGS